MKKIRCPKCKNFIIFDETKYTVGKRLSFCCPACRKQFGIKYGASSNKNTQAPEEPTEEINSNSYEYGSLYVIETNIAITVGKEYYRALYERKSY